jgi:hypothetical protein
MIQADGTFLLLQRRMITSCLHPGVFFYSNTKDSTSIHSHAGFLYTKMGIGSCSRYRWECSGSLCLFRLVSFFWRVFRLVSYWHFFYLPTILVATEKFLQSCAQINSSFTILMFVICSDMLLFLILWSFPGIVQVLV